MSRTERSLRIRVSTRGSDSVPGNVDLTFTDTDIPPGGAPGEWGGQSVVPIEGRVKNRGFTVEVHDRNEQVTSQLSSDFSSGTAFAEADILRRMVDISTSDDGGSTWTVEATGRLTSIRQKRENPAVYAIEVSSPIDELRRATVFDETKQLGSGNTPEATTSLWPGGLLKEWEIVDKVTYALTEVTDVTGDRVTVSRNIITDIIREGEPGRLSNIPQPNRQAIKDDLKNDVDSFRPEDAPSLAGEGHFKHLRLWVDWVHGSTSTADGAKTNYELFAQRAIFDKNGKVGQKVDQNGTKSRALKKISIFWPNDQPNVGQLVRCALYLPNVEPSSTVPLHLGGELHTDEGARNPEGGLHPIEWVKKVIDQTSTSYNDSQLNTKMKERAELPDLYPRLTEPIQALSNLRETVFRPFGLAPVVNASGEIEVQETIMPPETKVPDVENLTELDASNLAGPHPPDLSILSEEQVTKVNTQIRARNIDLSAPDQHDAWSTGGQEPEAADMQTYTSEAILEDQYPKGGEESYERHVDAFGKHAINLNYRYVLRHALEVGSDDVTVGAHVAEAILDRYAWGGVRTTAVTMEAARDLTPLDYVLVNVDSYPGLQGQTRGERRLMQVVRRSYRLAGATIELLDAGPDEQPLPMPSISATVVDAFQIDVTVGGSGGTSTALEGQRAVVEIARSDTEPASDAASWHAAVDADSQGTYSIHCLSPGSTYWIRAFQASEQRIRSARTDPISATTNSAGTPSSVTVVEDLGCAVRLSWTNGDSSLRTQILVDGTVQPVNEPPEATERWLRDLDPSTSYTFELRHIGPCGGATGSASLTHTTAAASTGPRTGGLFLLVGDRV